MKFFIEIIPFTLILGLDYLIKAWVSENHPHLTYINAGFLLGSFSEMPRIISSFLLFSISSFVICLYLTIRLTVTMQSQFLKTGLTLLVAAISGNLLDRVLYGAVIDYCRVGNVIFNLADIVLLISFGLIFYGLQRDSSIFWPKNDFRGKYWLNTSFQRRFCLQFTGAGLAVGAIFSVTGLAVINSIASENILLPMIISLFLLNAAVCIALFTLASFLSHRIAGPINAINRHLNATFAGKPSELRLRNKDELKELEAPLTELNRLITQGKNDEAA